MAVFDGIMSFQAMMNMSTFAAFINCLIYNPMDYELSSVLLLMLWDGQRRTLIVKSMLLPVA